MSECCGCFFFFVMLVVMAYNIVWLAVTIARSPSLPQFRIDSVSVSNFSYSDSNSSVTGNWNARFSVYNPNKKLSISYEIAQSALLYEHRARAYYHQFPAPEFTSVTRIPGFNQSARNRTFIDAAFASRDDYVDKEALRDINNVHGTAGSITFHVEVHVAGIKFMDAGSGHVVEDFDGYSHSVWCDRLVVSLSPSNSSASGSGKLVEPRDCDVL